MKGKYEEYNYHTRVEMRKRISRKKYRKICLGLAILLTASAMGDIRFDYNVVEASEYETAQEIEDTVQKMNNVIQSTNEEILDDIISEIEDVETSLKKSEKIEVEDMIEEVDLINDVEEAQKVIIETIGDMNVYEETIAVIEKELSVSSLDDFENQALINPYTGKEMNTVKEVEEYLLKENLKVDEITVELCENVEKVKEECEEITIEQLVEQINEDSQEELCETKSSFFSGTKVKAGGLYLETYAQWTSLTTDEKVLIACDPKKALITQGLVDKAYNFTAKKYGYNGLGDESDGFRHGVWNALMTRDISRSWASAYSKAHESGKTEDELNKRASDGYKEKKHRTMDLHNNEVGRSVINWYDTAINVSNKTLQNRVSDKLTNNKNTGIYWLHD